MPRAPRWLILALPSLTLGCSNAFTVSINNVARNGEFTITQVELWTALDGCSGTNLLSDALGPDETVRLDGLRPGTFEWEVGVCVDTTLGRLEPREPGSDGWLLNPGCTVSVTYLYSTYFSRMDANTDDISCSHEDDMFDPFGLLD